jgi:hypothetical protein
MEVETPPLQKTALLVDIGGVFGGVSSTRVVRITATLFTLP